MIEFKNLSIGFHDQPILKDLEGNINRGDCIALMGVNGVGKSCFLKTVSSLIPKLSGDLTVDSRATSTYTPLELARTLAIVLTDKVFVDFLSVEELVMLGRSPYTDQLGNLNQADYQYVDEILALLKIENMRKRFFSDLSDGQKQKVLLARALAQAPSFLFLDEPTTYLDIPSKIELMNLLKLISKSKNVGIFFSTHDLNLIEGAVDQIWLIDSAGVLHKKSPEEMKSSGLLEKNFNL